MRVFRVHFDTYVKGVPTGDSVLLVEATTGELAVQRARKVHAKVNPHLTLVLKALSPDVADALVPMSAWKAKKR